MRSTEQGKCHRNLGPIPETSRFEFGALNLKYAYERLRREHYDRWMYDPLRIDKTTKMPRYANEQGVTPFSEYLNGDAVWQFTAIWEYLLQLGAKSRD